MIIRGVVSLLHPETVNAVVCIRRICGHCNAEIADKFGSRLARDLFERSRKGFSCGKLLQKRTESLVAVLRVDILSKERYLSIKRKPVVRFDPVAPIVH